MAYLAEMTKSVNKTEEAAMRLGGNKSEAAKSATDGPHVHRRGAALAHVDT